MSTLLKVDTASFEAEVLQSSLPTLVDFYAPWCAPCRAMNPVLERLAARFAGQVKFVKLDEDQDPEIASRYAITKIPNFMLFVGGEPVDSLVGYVGEEALASRLTAHLGEA